jgi:hypothetical protein
MPLDGPGSLSNGLSDFYKPTEAKKPPSWADSRGRAMGALSGLTASRDTREVCA